MMVEIIIPNVIWTIFCWRKAGRFHGPCSWSNRGVLVWHNRETILRRTCARVSQRNFGFAVMILKLKSKKIVQFFLGEQVLISGLSPIGNLPSFAFSAVNTHAGIGERAQPDTQRAPSPISTAAIIIAAFSRFSSIRVDPAFTACTPIHAFVTVAVSVILHDHRDEKCFQFPLPIYHLSR